MRNWWYIRCRVKILTSFHSDKKLDFYVGTECYCNGIKSVLGIWIRIRLDPDLVFIQILERPLAITADL
jgi:hypothetical protein